MGVEEKSEPRVLRVYLPTLDRIVDSVNSLTPKSVPARTKNSRSEGFLLVKHKHTNIPTMMEPFLPPTAWDLWILSEGVGRGGWWKGFSRINKLNEKIIYFYCLSINYNNRSPAVGNDSQHGIHCCRRAVIIYELN